MRFIVPLTRKEEGAMGLDVKLTTERLVVRTANEDDAAAVANYLTANRKYQVNILPTLEDEFFTESFWRNQIAADRLALANDTALRLILTTHDAPDTVIGMIYFSQFQREPNHSCRLWCALDHDAEGNGYMAEALLAAIAYAFAKQNFHRIEVAYPVGAERCENLFGRLGFEVEGRAHRYRRTEGRWHDHIIAALINRHWEAPQ